MNKIEIYKDNNDIPNIIIESQNEIDSSSYIIELGECLEEIYINNEIVFAILHNL
jgi:hypothetical protein